MFQGLPLAVRIAGREMRGGFRGFGVFLGCLFLGVFALSAIGSFSESAARGLLADARSLLGGDFELRLVHREPTPEQFAWLRDRAQLSSTVEMRAMARAPQADPAEPDERVLVELKAVDRAYPLYGEVALDPPQTLESALVPRNEVHGAAADEDLLRRLGVGLGDRILVGDAALELRAVIRAEPDRTIRAFSLGPRLLVRREALPATGLLAPGSLVTYRYRARLPAGTPAPPVLTALERAFPEAGWRVRTYQDAAPRVRFFLDRMAVNLTLVGLCSLLVGGLGVAGGVRGYLGTKTKNLATMKCLGATGQFLFRSYLLQILALAAIGITAGALAGAAVPWAVGTLFGDVVPVPLARGIFVAPLARAAAFGFLIAFAFSLPSLGAARHVPPAVLFRGYVEARPPRPGIDVQLAVAGAALLLFVLALVTSGDPRLTLWFAAGAALCFVLFRAVASGVVRAAKAAPRARSPSLRLGVANIHRPGSPARSTLFSLGLGLTALVAVVLVEADLSSLVGETVPEEAPAFFFIDIQPSQVTAFQQITDEMAGVTRVERLPTLRGRITHIAGVPVEEASIDPQVSWAVRGDRFLTYAARPPDPEEVSAGAWWPEDYTGPPLLSLTADLARGFGVEVGDTITVNVLGRSITGRIANLRVVDWSSLALNFAIIFAPGAIDSAPQSHLAAVYVRPEDEAALFDAVTGEFPNVSAIRVREVLQNVSRTLERIGGVFQAVAGLALLTGFLVLAGALSADQHRRIYDAVIFKVCGATRRDILATFFTEFAILGLSAGAISAAAGSAAAFGIVRGLMDAKFSIHPAAVLGTVLLGLGIALFLGLAGTARALTRKPSLYLRNE